MSSTGMQYQPRRAPVGALAMLAVLLFTHCGGDREVLAHASCEATDPDRYELTLYANERLDALGLVTFTIEGEALDLGAERLAETIPLAGCLAERTPDKLEASFTDVWFGELYLDEVGFECGQAALTFYADPDFRGSRNSEWELYSCGDALVLPMTALTP